MQCPHCQADNQEGRYCVKCGKPLEENITDLDETIAMQAVDVEETPASTDASESENEMTSESNTSEEAVKKPSQSSIEEWARGNDVFFEEFEAQEASENAKRRSRLRKLATALALIGGLVLAAGSAYYLFDRTFGQSGDVTAEDANRAIADADIVAADGEVAADSIVGFWRHYNTGSTIEKIGNERYRWTIEDAVYELRFSDDVYRLEDADGNLYYFVLNGADRLKMVSSTDADGGLIKNPVFESGYTAGRVGQDGSMARNLSLNTDAFNIIGKTYAELAGTYGPGSLSVVGDDQYIVFRGKGGNFAVQFTGNTVPLSEQHVGSPFQIVKLASDNTGTVDDDNNNNDSGNTSDPGVTPAYPDTSNGNNSGSTNSNSSNNSSSDKKDDEDEDKKYTVEIPDMPTFPSTTAVASGVVWADLGFLVNNAPDTMTVNDLSAILKISLEVGEAGANSSGFYFYGMDDGYFSGNLSYNDHTFNISGYGKDNLSAGKTIVFIQMVS